MIDIHSHILPQIDDGSRSIEETIRMLEEAKGVGFTDIISTSHYMNGVYVVETEEREKILESLKMNENIDINLYNGAEIYVCPELEEILENNFAPTLNNTRYVLIELPMKSEIIYLEKIIKMIKDINLVPIIAHPERYEYWQKEPNKMIKYIKRGVLFQSNYGSILGIYGKKPQKAVKKMLKHNFIHFLGSDCHRHNSIYKKIPYAVEEIKKIVGNRKFKELSEKNPSRVLENKEIRCDEPIKIRRLFG